jgi:MscS family membrane protein
MRNFTLTIRLAATGFAVLIALGWVLAAQRSMADPSQAPTLKEVIKGSAQQRGATPGAAPEVERMAVPDDEFGRGTPRSTVRGFLAAARARNFERAANYLDLRNLPAGLDEREGPQLARQLKVVLDRVLWVDVDVLSTSPEGDPNDGLPSARDRVGRLIGRERPYDILLQRVPRGDGVEIWKFAGATVAEIPGLYTEFGYGRLEAIFPPWFFDVQVLGIEVWFWVALVIAACVAFPVAMLLTAALIALRRRIHPASAEEAATFLTGPLRLLIAVLLVRGLMSLTGLSLVAQALTQAATLVVVALAWLGLRLLDLFAQRIARRLETRGLVGAIILMKPAARLLKLVVLVGAGLLWLDNLGYKVTTLLAGLSISGVAVALASQKSLENIFGAVTLYSSQPVKVGDFCRFGEKIGTIEEIGLRATRIRTLDRSVITVSNAEFANMHLENLSARDRMWYHPTIRLRYETTPDQIRYLLVEVRKMLYAHPRVWPEGAWVRFKQFGEYSFDLEVFAYIATTDYTESLEIAEDLNLRIMDIVAAAGTQFAVPSQIQYELPGKELDQGRARTAEAMVKEWRAQQALYLPNFPEGKIAELRGSLDYPPAGSPVHARERG